MPLGPSQPPEVFSNSLSKGWANDLKELSSLFLLKNWLLVVGMCVEPAWGDNS